MASPDKAIPLNPFDLPTQQRRLRHFKSLAVRNLVCKGYMGRDVVKLQTYFTLHRDVESRAFYTSEKIIGSLNPSWQSFDLSRLGEEVDMAAKFVVVRVWGGHDKKFRLLLEWQVHFSGLVFLTEKLQKDGMKFAANSLVFGLFEKYFTMLSESRRLQQPSSEASNESRQPSIRVDQMTVHNSYGVSSLARIHTVLRAIRQTQVTVRRVHRSIEDKLLASQETSSKLSEREELLLKVNQLRGELQWQTTQLQCDKDRHDRQRNLLKLRGLELKENFTAMSNQREELLHGKQQHIVTRETLVKTNAQLNMRRKQLIEELATYIYPIKEMPDSQDHTICGVKLPNAEEFHGHDDSSIAVALGYTCHMVVMMSEFLDTPLWYPLEHRGSKSVIRDHIISKLADKDRMFVLYGKSKDRIQFHYGVYLLNKNISQLRYQFGLGTQDLRLTLHNLKSLLELRLGVKYDTVQKPIHPSVNMAGRQVSVDTNNTHSKDGLLSGNHGNDLCEGRGNDLNDRHGHEEQMLEQLMQESRAMTGNSSQAWVENLNSKSTWSPSMQKKFENNHSGQGSCEVEKNYEDIFKASDDEFFKAQNSAPEELLSGEKLYAANNTVVEMFGTHESRTILESGGMHAPNPRSPDKLKRQNAQESFDSEFRHVLGEKCSTQTSEHTHTQTESEAKSANQCGNSQIQQDSLSRAESESAGPSEANLTRDSSQITQGSVYSDSSIGTFKTSAFSKVTSIDSSEEVTEQTDLSPLDARNSVADPSDLTNRTEVLCEGPTSFRQIDDLSKATISN